MTASVTRPKPDFMQQTHHTLRLHGIERRLMSTEHVRGAARCERACGGTELAARPQAELQERLVAAGLPKSGTKAQLSARLAAYLESTSATDAAPADGAAAGEAVRAEESVPRAAVSEAAEAAAAEVPRAVVSEAVEAAAAEERSAALDGDSEDTVVRGREARVARRVAFASA